ncbi:PAS domain S-box protein [Zavarzinella formosa]|uniref:PAS domain S-box protein n=1 Tax=Zavarzinella formosa TaxID=360055 RepID=UPI0003162EAB|nr:PAS domain S-box protein [Zavarzinella formosa]
MATILLVDDRPVNREFLVALLGYGGHRLLEAADGAEGLELARTERPDLVITDILMPTMDGYEFVRLMRADPRLADTPVIFCTAHYHEPEARKLAAACGAAAVLTKPCEPELVLRTVEAALGLVAPAPPVADETKFDHEHMRLLTDKLSEKADELRRTNERLTVLVELGQRLGSERDPAKIIEAFGSAAREIVGARYAVVGVLNGGGAYRFVITSGMDVAMSARIGRPAPLTGVLGSVLAAGRSFRAANRHSLEAIGLPPGFPAAGAILAAPLASPSKVYGWVCLLDKVGADAFTEEDERLVMMLGGQVGRIYENGSLYRDLLQHASKLAEEASERKRGEEALRESEERFRGAFEHTGVATVITDLDNRAIRVNAAFARLFGYAPAEMIGLTVADVTHPDDLAESLARRNELLTGTGQFFQMEKRYLHRDGRVFWGLTNISLIRGPDGWPLQYVAQVQDITDRKRAEEAVSASEERFRAFMDNAPAVAFIKDEDGRYVYVNATWIRRFDGKVPDWRGKNDHELWPRETADTLRVGDLQCLALNASIQREETVRLLGDESTWLVMKFPLLDGGQKRLLGGMAWDITDRKNAEADSRRSAELLRAVADGTTDAVFVKDREGKYLLFNEAAARFVGMPASHVLGRDDTELFDPAGAALVMARDRRVAATGQVETEEETLTAAGETRIYLATKGPYRGARGDIIGTIGISRDITDRKRTEDDLRRSQAILSMASRVGRMGAWAVELPDLNVIWSEELRAIYGLAPNQSPGVEEGLHYYTPEYRDTVREAFDACVRGGIPFDLEVQTDTLRGERLWVRVIGEAVRDAHGAIKGAQGTFQNITDRKGGEQRLMTQHAVVSILAQAADLREAAPKLLRAVCEYTGWDIGGFWVLDHQAKAMTHLDLWHAEDLDAHEFHDLSRRITFAPWVGLPGRVWASGRSLWIADFAKEMNFPRVASATKAGLRSGFGFPIEFGHEVLGVAEFFSRESRRPDDELLRMFDSLGSQVGQFIERKRVEEGLRLFRSLIDQATDGIEVVDPLTGRYLDVNERTCVAHGYTREEMLELGVPDIDPLVSTASWARVIHSRRQNETRSFESIHRRKDGSTFPVEINLNFILADREYVVAAVRDITERKQAEAELRQVQQRLTHVLASSPAVLFTLIVSDNQIRGMSWISDNLREMLGYAPADAYARNWWPDNLHPEEREAVVARNVAGLFGQGHVAHEYRFRHADGNYRWTRGEIRLIRDASGAPTEAVGAWSDITERKHLEDQFRQSQKMEAVGRLAGGVAHDFNNLLTVINGYGEMILGSVSADDPMRELVREIVDAGERASGLTRQLLTFSRKAIIEPKSLDLKEVVADVGRMLRRIVGEDIQLTVTSDPRVGAVMADPSQMEQVILNLVVNARDAMPRGGRLMIEVRNVELDENYTRTHPDARPGPHVLLAVTDTGSGMSAATVARIFEPFFSTKGDRGTGIGLATLHGIVRQAGGHVGVYSELGRGTTFKVYFPQIDVHPAASKSGQFRAAMPKGRETILLVEDEEAVRAFAKRVLGGCGYTVLEARDGDEAVKLVAEHKNRIDLLVTDVVMPRIGGREVAERTAALHPTIKVLFLSGYTDDAVVRHGILEADVAFLQKPFTPMSLAAKVREVLDGH